MKTSTNTAKRTLACFVMTLGLTLSTYGIPFCGTITQTITTTNDPSFYVGQIATGWYQYEASEIDGTFAANFFGVGHQGETPPLCGSLFSFAQSPNGGNGWLPLAGVVSRFAELTVQDSNVSDFHFFTEYGNSHLSFRFSTFDVTTNYLDQIADTRIDYNTGGTMCFSTPVAVVPESTATVGLVMLSLAGLGLLRRWFAA